jgi:hypothetical protein
MQQHYAPSADLFWLNNGFFDERRLFYFPAAEANTPTRMLCKAALVDIFAGRAVEPPRTFLSTARP